MPSITNPYSTATVLPQQFAFCLVKQYWSDDWQLAPWLFPSEAVDAAAPEIGSATLYYEFGSISRQGAASFTSWEGYNVLDWYVQIMVMNEGFGPMPVWTGIITDDNATPDRGDTVSGRQILKAYTIAHLLDRDPISKGRAYANGGSQVLSWLPTFNDKGKYGRKVIGNRSNTQNGSAYYFGDDGEVWNNLQIARYLCKYHSPDAFFVSIAGQTDALSEIEQVHDFDGMTFWECLNKLIDRRRGLGFVPIVQGSILYIYVFSVVDRPYRVKRKTIMGNPNNIYLQMPDVYPYNHLIGSIQFRRTAANRVDVLEVRGPRIKCMGTFAYDDGTLEKGWTDDLEDAYDSADGGSDDKENDRQRSADRFKGVYTRLRVPKDWDGRVGDGQSGGKNNILLKANNDGTLSTDKSGFWPQNKSFLRELPIQVGEDPNGGSENPSDAEPEYLPLLAVVKDDTDGTYHTASNKWVILDRAEEADPNLRSVTVRPLDRELGVELHASPRHYLALGHFDGASASKTEPELDWQKICITAMLEIDERPHILIENAASSALDAQRKIVIDVPEAEYWYMATDSIYDIGTSGEPLRIKPNDPENEEDFAEQKSSILEQVAAFALAWYSKFRQAVQIPIAQMGVYVPIGAMLTEIRGKAISEQINTPVTGWRIDFQNQTTVVECGWNALDIVTASNNRNMKRTKRKGRI